jgi:YVTN family beta-propeller protein
LSGTNEVAVIDTRNRQLIKRISGVGEDPWGTHMVGTLNYCH